MPALPALPALSASASSEPLAAAVAATTTTVTATTATATTTVTTTVTDFNAFPPVCGLRCIMGSAFGILLVICIVVVIVMQKKSSSSSKDGYSHQQHNQQQNQQHYNQQSFAYSPAGNAPFEAFEAANAFFRDYPPNQPFRPSGFESELEALERFGPASTLRLELDDKFGQFSHLVHVGPSPTAANTTAVRFSQTGNLDLALQTNLPMPCCISSADHGTRFYFEVTLRGFGGYGSGSGERPAIAIGVASRPYPCFRMPGWHLNSVGYHIDDGHKFVNDADGGVPYGPAVNRVGDVVGCGYDASNGTVMFTLNGRSLGTAATRIYGALYPSVGADGPCEMDVNFGSKPFAYQGPEATGYAGRLTRFGGHRVNYLQTPAGDAPPPPYQPVYQPHYAPPAAPASQPPPPQPQPPAQAPYTPGGFVLPGTNAPPAVPAQGGAPYTANPNEKQPPPYSTF